MPGTVVRHASLTSEFVAARHVDVWLPAGYDTGANRRFPVLYMHDGQNLFDPAIAYGGVDWGVGKALERLNAAGRVPATMVVGIWNSDQRWQDYLPRRPFEGEGGAQALAQLGPEFKDGPRSDAYLRFIVQELKPFIDQSYPTLPGRESTYIMGSSMGGLISLYALCEYPDAFGGAGCLSTHWPPVASVMPGYLRQQLPQPGAHRIYFDYGTETLDAQYKPHQKRVDAVMETRGYREGVDWVTLRFQGAEHSEKAWRERVHLPLEFLLGDRPAS